MILHCNESNPGVVRIDGVCGSRPTFFAHFLEIVICKFIQKVQMFDSIVVAIRNMNTKTMVVFCDVQSAFFLFVRIALLIESPTDTPFQDFNVFQWPV